MNKIIAGFVGLCATCLCGWWIGYSMLNTADVAVDQAWAQIESVLQRRADLVPNLVNTVKGYAKHEQKTFESITAKRAEIGKLHTGDGFKDDSEKFNQYINAHNQLSQDLGKLIAVSENYPSLKADTNFLNLQSQLEGTENRIAVQRLRYNEAVGTLNVRVRSFVLRLIAQVHGFKQRSFFKALETAQQAPAVNFD